MNDSTFKMSLAASLILSTSIALPTFAHATSDCTFDDDGSTITLEGDCTTDMTIFIPDGYTLDGRGYAITGIDPPAGHFVGPVVSNAGTTAHIKKVVVQVSALANVCDADADRLRGIMFEGASGTIWQNLVQGINQGASGCQEGNAIEVRNAPFDGTHPGTQSVEISHNIIEGYQKTGIVCNGDVICEIHNNFVGESATQDDLAANSVQVGFGASAIVELNQIAGNQWQGTSDFVATAILLYLNEGSSVSRNNIGGNSDIGLYIFGNLNAVSADNNRIFDGGLDHVNSSYDIGIGDYGVGNEISNNKIRGFDISVDGALNPETQKIIPSPNIPPEICFGTDC